MQCTLASSALWRAVHFDEQCTLMCEKAGGKIKVIGQNLEMGGGLIYTKHVSNNSTLWRASHFNLQKKECIFRNALRVF